MILGFVLVIVELSIGTFLFLGLGIAAVLVGVICLLANIYFTSEVLIWIMLSIAAISIWIKWYKSTDVSNTGQSNYGLDIKGTVLETIKPGHRGSVRFDAPVLGNTIWYASSASEISRGERVTIVDIDGQIIHVSPINQQGEQNGNIA